MYPSRAAFTALNNSRSRGVTQAASPDWTRALKDVSAHPAPAVRVGYVGSHMASLSFTGLFVLQALAQGHRFGFDIMEVTELPSGTVYPALRRLESQGLVRSDWEADEDARANARPRRRYYELTRAGKAQLAEAESRYRAVSKLFPKRGRA